MNPSSLGTVQLHKWQIKSEKKKLGLDAKCQLRRLCKWYKRVWDDGAELEPIKSLNKVSHLSAVLDLLTMWIHMLLCSSKDIVSDHTKQGQETRQ